MAEVNSSNEIQARHFHATKQFIDELYAINEGIEFGSSNPPIYS